VPPERTLAAALKRAHMPLIVGCLFGSRPVREDAVMRVRFAGSGDAFGSGGRWQTCIHLSGEGQVLLVDCGATSLVALKSQGLDPGAVDAVAVTHLHGDHFGGLPFLILDGQFSRRSAPLQVAGPPGIRARLAEAMEALFPGSSQAQRRFPVEVTELGTDGKAAGLGAATVRGWEVKHACGAPPLALRVELGGTSFVYSGDTEWTAVLAEAAHGADLFAVEAYTFDRPVRYHLDYRTLRAHLGEIRARRIVLTHMSAAMLTRLADADLPAAYDGMTADL
jgi:ribonuclease BN (tRNA processing enzyme)